MSSYFQGQNYTINELPSNADPLKTALTAFAAIKNQKLDNRNATLNNVLDNATIFANNRMTNNQKYAQNDDYKKLLLAKDDELRANNMPGLFAPGVRAAIESSNFTGEDWRAVLGSTDPFYRNKEANLNAQRTTRIAEANPGAPGSDTIMKNNVTGAATGPSYPVYSTYPTAQEALSPSSNQSPIVTPNKTVASESDEQTSSQAPVTYTPGQPLTAGVSFTNQSNPALDYSDPRYGRTSKATATGKEQENTLRGADIQVEQEARDRIGYGSNNQPVVKFNGIASKIPVDDKTMEYIKMGQSQVIISPDKYINNKATTQASAEKYRQFLGHIDNIEQTVQKYGDLQPLYNAISTADLAGGGKYIEQVAATRYPGMNPAELRSLTASVQALKSYRPTFAKDAGDVGNFSQSEQDVFNYLADAGKYLDPQNIQILKQVVYDKIGNSIYINGVAYGVSDAADIGYQLRQTTPSLTKQNTYQLQNIAPIPTQGVQQNQATRPAQMMQPASHAARAAAAKKTLENIL